MGPLLGSLLAQFLLAQATVGQTSCTVDTQNSCKAKCGSTTLNIADTLKYPYVLTTSDGENVTYSPCAPINCGAGCGTNSTPLCMTNSNGKCEGSASTEGMEWTLQSSLYPIQFLISYACSASEPGCIEFNVLFVEDKQLSSAQIVLDTEVHEPLVQLNISAKCIGQSGCGENLAGPIGFILIAVFLLCVILYLVIGAVFKHFVKGAEGIEIIPNVNFWVGLPGLLKDGCLFVVSPCYKSSTSYQEL